MYACRVAGEMASLAKNKALCKRTSLAGAVAALRVLCRPGGAISGTA